MAHLTKQQTLLIRNEISLRGISPGELAEDLLDHICSAVEDHMASGESFELAFALVMSNFERYELQKVQAKTQALLEGEKIYYPDLKQAFGLILLFHFLMFMVGKFILGPIKRFHPEFFNPNIFLIETIYVSGILLLVIGFAKLELKERSFTKVNIFSLNPFPFSIFYLIIPILFLWSIWMEMITSFIPVSDAMQALIAYKLTYVSPIPLFLLLGIFWPLLTEILYRTIILKGFLRKYTPLKAILWSSVFYAVSTLNPYNLLPLFLLGLFCGWLFYRTHSLLPSLIIQTLIGFLQVIHVLWAKPQSYEQLLIWRNLVTQDVVFYGLGVLSLLLTLFLIWRLKKIFDQQQYITHFSIE